MVNKITMMGTGINGSVKGFVEANLFQKSPENGAKQDFTFFILRERKGLEYNLRNFLLYRVYDKKVGVISNLLIY